MEFSLTLPSLSQKNQIKVADHGPAIEEVTGFGEDADADNSEVSRPKPIKALSDKRKAALLKRGDPNPAANLRSELAYKAELEQYKKSKGFVVEQVNERSERALWKTIIAHH